jgi:histidinol-phosphate aminotransferase
MDIPPARGQYMIGPSLTALVESLPSTVPFVGPEAQERGRGRRFRARIGANENVFGPSPLAVEAMCAAAAEAWMYGDPENYDLKLALAKRHNVAPQNIVVGEGIDGLFGYIARMTVEPGTAVVTSLGAYPTFNFHITGFGGRLLTVPYRDDHEDIAALLDGSRREGARLIFLANPDNPMGTWWRARDVGADPRAPRWRAFVPRRGLLRVRAARSPGAARRRQPAGAALSHLLQGLWPGRRAHRLCHRRGGLIKSFDKIRNHFGVNRIAQAGALAALADDAYLAHVIAEVAAARHAIAEIAAANGLEVLPSGANFVAIDCGRDGDFARRVLGGLIARDIFVRMPGVAPLDRCIRVSAGRPADLDAFAAALPEALGEARA